MNMGVLKMLLVEDSSDDEVLTLRALRQNNIMNSVVTLPRFRRHPSCCISLVLGG